VGQKKLDVSGVSYQIASINVGILKVILPAAIQSETRPTIKYLLLGKVKKNILHRQFLKE
jgi:hypothetical protein